MIEAFIFIFTGALTGIAAGLFGLGGGLIIVPVVTYSLISFSNISFNQAILSGICTSLASMVITGAMATYIHTKNKNIDYKIINKFVIGVVFGALLIGFIINIFPGEILKNLFIIYTFFIAFRIYAEKNNVIKNSSLPNNFVSNLIGFIFSIISGLVGIGGATLFVPFLIRNNIPAKLAIGTSSALGFLIGLGASISIFLSSLYLEEINNSMFGFVYLPAILFLTVPSLIFVPLSANWLLKISDANVKKLFSSMLLIIGLLMLLN
tara:strand:- start:1048 stop:1842 length:795 start_codon:yes stop_codon:yes gene_type:complete